MSMPRLTAVLLVSAMTGSSQPVGAECLFAALERAVVEDGVQSTAHVVTTSDDGIVKLGRNVLFADDTRVAADRVRLGDGSSVCDVAANHVSEGDDCAIRGMRPRVEDSAVKADCTVPTVTCGGADVAVGHGERRRLAPGRYDAIVLEPGSTLELAEGSYEVCSLDADRHAVVIAGGDTTLAVRDELELGNGCIIGLGADGAPPRIQVAGDASVRIGRNADVTAVLSAPGCAVDIGDGSQFAGAICARRFETGKRTELSCADALGF